MQLVNDFTVPAPADVAWGLLSDLERVASCLPGAVVDGHEGAEYRGRVAVKVGPVGLSFGGVATVIERDDAQRRLVVRGAASDAKGQGGAEALITLTVAEAPAASGSSAVRVVTDLGLSGKVAQFGAGMINQVNRRLLREFTQRLDRMVREAGAAPTAAPTPAAAAPARMAALVRGAAGPALATAAAGALLGVAIIRAIRVATRR